MTGPLNPRRYDLGELRDAARDPSGRSEADGSDPQRPDGGRRDAATSVDGDRGDGGQSVPVEPTTPRPTGTPPRESDAGRAADAVDRSRRHEPAESRDTGAVSGSEAGHRTPEPDRGRAAADTAERHEPADEVESYLRSRHRRRDTGERRSEHHSHPAGDRAASRPDRRRATSRPERPGDGRPPNAAALLSELSGPDVSKPYLDRLPDAYTAQLEVFEWLEELLTAAGRDGALSALEYYESIGWLSERSREELEDVASGLSDPAPEAAAPSLGIEDHRGSLVYIARLAGRRNG
ncbi:fla cluster protein FlaD [Natronomonas moolapensis 8.8.11]|uniref:Fla cluster protein FlaD n=1 Tax=Natronomonas moolapensis (strain DSM 18674 / CECT 7526 / JCM 14361 / 8.8.11) TaxID=268739 RepID=M1XRP5_NATM8|nr:FlaD/FlaE family flagellar protein [Natronomonas moolapensis]CCQ36944.1 fla cluster protein FlaD [Natronomonas moolapensis 8.8.11]